MMTPPHVVVVAFPFASHAVKLFRVARALAAAAPAATFTFLCTATTIARLQKGVAALANLRFVEIAERGPAAAGEVDAAPLPHLVRVGLFMAFAEAGGVKEALEAARASADGATLSCVVADAFMWMSAEPAAALGAPWVPVWTGGPSALLAHLRADALRADIGGENASSRADELLTSHFGLGSYRVRDLPEGVVSGDPNHPVRVLFRRMAQTLPHATTAIALNTFPGLLPEEVMDALAVELPKCLPVGPFHHLPGTDDEKEDDPHKCLPWLDGHADRTVVYVSFGTIAGSPPEELRELAAGLEAAGAPFLWALPEESWQHLPPGFVERGAGLVVPWAPQVQVLRHASVGAFVTHAGWASVLEGVSSGVPMACRPFFSDQMMNARSVNVLGFGATLDQPVTAEGVAAVLASLLSAEEGGRMWTRMQELRDKMDRAFAPDGGSKNNFDKLVKIICAV